MHPGKIVTISGITIRNGRAVSSANPHGLGGGIYSTGTLNLNDSFVRDNTAFFGGGIYNDGGALTLTSSIINGNASIHSGGGGGGIYSNGTMTLSDTTLSGNTAFFGGGIMGGGTLIFTDISISGNTASIRGGGIYNNGGVLSLTNGPVSGNTAGNSGGGIYSSGTLTMIDSPISGNTAVTDGGGVWANGTLTLTNSPINGNTAGSDGGGVYNSGSTLTLPNITVTGNTASGNGGGIWSSGALTLPNSTISSNIAGGNGGGILFSNPSVTLTLTNSTISSNEAIGGSGGGILISSGTAKLTNVTISNNSGGGLANVGGEVVPTNTIIANSSGGDCSGVISSPGYNLDSDGSCDFVAPGDISGVDPLLGPLADNGGLTLTHALPTGSPAIDAVPIARCLDADGNPLNIDQRGVTRPQGVACDIGAYELEFVSGGICGDQNDDGNVDIFDAIIDLQISVGLIEPTPEQLRLSDVVSDGAINIFDVILILQYITGLIPSLSECGLLVGYDFEGDFLTSGRVIDRSGNGHNAQLAGNVGAVKGINGGQAISFSGSSYIQAERNPVAGRRHVTFSLWFNTDHPEANYKLASAAWWSGGPGSGWILATHIPEFWSDDTQSLYLPNLLNIDNHFPAGEWVHEVVTYDGDRIKEYTNGNLVNDWPTTGAEIGTGEPIALGAWPPFSGFNFVGAIDEFQIFDRAFTPEEVQAVYNLNHRR